jgi:hypothetical protein
LFVVGGYVFGAALLDWGGFTPPRHVPLKTVSDSRQDRLQLSRSGTDT